MVTQCNTIHKWRATLIGDKFGCGKLYPIRISLVDPTGQRNPDGCRLAAIHFISGYDDIRALSGLFGAGLRDCCGLF
jgi:hypothetical protein